MPPQPVDDLIEKIKISAPPLQEWAVIWGYLGELYAGTVKDDDGTDVPAQFQRIYLDLSRQRWVEINTDFIATSHQFEEGRGSLVWVPRETSLVEVRIRRAREFDSATGFLAGSFWRQRDWDDDDGGGGGGPPGTKVPGRC